MGKSLFVRKMSEELQNVTKTTSSSHQVIPIHGPVVTSDIVLSFLKNHYHKDKCMIYHFDIAPNVSASVGVMLLK